MRKIDLAASGEIKGVQKHFSATEPSLRALCQLDPPEKKSNLLMFVSGMCYLSESPVGFSRKEKHAGSKARCQAAFRVIDRDMDGKITTADLRKLFPTMTEMEADRMIAASDFKGNGGLDFSQFQTMLQQYFTSEPQMDWPKPTSKNEATRKAKAQALEPHHIRTADDDEDSRSSCAASSVSMSASRTLSRLESDSESEDSDEAEETEEAKPTQSQSGLSSWRLPGAPLVRLAKAETTKLEATIQGDVANKPTKTDGSWQKGPYYVSTVRHVISL